MQVYISQPLENRTNEDIEISRAYAIKRVKELGHEVIDDYARPEPQIQKETRDTNLIYLANSIKKLSEAGAIYFIDNWENSPRCQIHRKICDLYGIKVFEG